MKGSVADGSKVDENDIAVRLLQGDRSVHGGCRAARAAFGAEESEDSRFARPAKTTGA